MTSAGTRIAVVALLLLVLVAAEDISLTVRLVTSNPLEIGSSATVSLSIQNSGEYDTEVMVALDAPRLEPTSLAEPEQNLGYLDPGAKGQTDWRVTARGPGNYTICANVTGLASIEMDYPTLPVCVNVTAIAKVERKNEAINSTVLTAKGVPKKGGLAEVRPPLNLTLARGAITRENGSIQFKLSVENTGTRGDVVTVNVEGKGAVDVDPTAFNLPPGASRSVNILVQGTDLLDITVTVKDDLDRLLVTERVLDRPEETTDWARAVVPLLMIIPIILVILIKGRAMERLLPSLYVQRFESVIDVRERESELMGRRIALEGKVILDENFEFFHTVYVYDASGDYLAATTDMQLEEGIYTVTGRLGRAEHTQGYVQEGELLLQVESARGEWQSGASLFAMRNHIRAVAVLAVLYLLVSRRIRDITYIAPWGNLQYLAIAPFSLPLIPILFALVPLLVALVMGPVFCGWACPVGFFHEVIGTRLSKPRKALARLNDRNIKYLGLLVVIVVTLGFRTPALCRVCPFGDVLARIELDTGISADAFAGGVFAWRLGILGALILAAILIQPIYWCKNLCPYGALLSVMGITKWTEVHVQRQACVDCGLCEKMCPYELGILTDTHMNECTSCGKCVSSCFKNALTLNFNPGLIRQNLVPAVLGLLVVAIILMFPFISERLPVTIDYTKCIKCGACWEQHPKFFAEDERTGFPVISEASAVKVAGLTPEDADTIIAVCPVDAISVED